MDLVDLQTQALIWQESWQDIYDQCDPSGILYLDVYQDSGDHEQDNSEFWSNIHKAVHGHTSRQCPQCTSSYAEVQAPAHTCTAAQYSQHSFAQIAFEHRSLSWL